VLAGGRDAVLAGWAGRPAGGRWASGGTTAVTSSHAGFLFSPFYFYYLGHRGGLYVREN
jgi:hypothetical protein